RFPGRSRSNARPRRLYRGFGVTRRRTAPQRPTGTPVAAGAGARSTPRARKAVMALFSAGVGAVVLLAATVARPGLPLHGVAAPDNSAAVSCDSLARRWLERNDEREAKDWNALLARRFAHVDLGLFEVYLPPSSVGDKAALKDVAGSLQALLDAQRGWQAWAG